MKDSFIFEGKKYISAKRASEISDYSSDYIGQLCRAEKLDCRMIGRSWFVTEESIRLHQANVLHDEIYRNRIENLKGGKKAKKNSQASIAAQPAAIVVPAIAAVTAPPSIAAQPASIGTPAVVTTEPVTAPTSVASIVATPIKYESDDRPLMPVLAKGTHEVAPGVSSTPVVENVVAKYFKRVESVDSAPIAPHESAVQSSAASFAPVASHVTHVNVSHVADAEVASIVSESSKTSSDISSDVSSQISITRAASKPTYPELARSLILRRALNAAIVITLVLAAAVGGAFLIAPGASDDQVATSFAVASEAPEQQPASIYTALMKAAGFVHDGFNSVLALFGRGREIASNQGSGNGNGGTNGVTSDSGSENGIAVAPSSGNSDVDAATKARIQANFSDQVEVHPDSSGTTGVITPVFRQAKGTDFIYVMVPVNGTRSP